VKRRPPQSQGVSRETPEARLAALGRAHGLDGVRSAQLADLLDWLARAPAAPTTVTAPIDAVDVHLADSLSALMLPELRDPREIADLGSGAGFPALALAVARPSARVIAVESVARKCDFIASAAQHVGLANLEVVCARAEDWSEGISACDVVCARALASLGAVCG